MSPPDVRSWLLAHTNLEPALLEGPGLDRAVAERLRHLGVDEAAYLEQLAHGSREVERLLASIAVPESWLFRYPRSFALLAEHLSTLRSEAIGPHRLRMLSVACSRGEEPCSMAITARHAGWRAREVEVVAIDVDRDLIERAGAGCFDRHSRRGDEPPWTTPWLTVEDEVVRVEPEITGMISFRHHDVLRDPDLGSDPFDVIFCRNLMIYLKRTARARLAARLDGWLGPEGLLFVGHAEQTAPFEDRFEPVRAPQAFAFRRRRTVDRPTSLLPERRNPALTAGSPRPSAAKAAPPRRRPAPPREAAPPAPVSLADARALADRGSLEAALRAVEDVIAREGPAVEPLELHGTLQLALGRLDGARDSFRKAVYLDPDHEHALLQLAIVCERLDEGDQAARYRLRAERAHQRDASTDEVRHER